MLDSGHEVCSRKLKSKPHATSSFFEEKGKEVWCLLGNAGWFLLGKHSTCLQVGAIWLKGKTKITKIQSKNKWKEPVQTIMWLVNNVTKRFVRSQNAKVSFLYLSVKLWLSLEIADCNAEVDKSEIEWQTTLTKQQEKPKTTLFTFPSWQELIASSGQFLWIIRRVCQKSSEDQMCLC